MAIREYRKTGETVEWEYEAVQAYLIGKGYVIGPGGLGTALEVAADGTTNELVRLDIDANVPDATLKADLDAFTPAPNPERTARGYLRKRAKAILAKAPATRTQAENDLLAVCVLLRQDS